MITDGKYRARATGNVVLGRSADKGTPFIECYFKIIPETDGGEVRWTSYFTDKSAPRTIEAMQHAGWEGDDPGEFADGDLHGLDKNEVEIVVELEEYNDAEGNPRTKPRVQWVNRLGGMLNVQNAMSKEDALSFGDQMKGLVLKMKSKKASAAPSGNAIDFPFGANAPANEKQIAAGNGRKF